MGEEERELDFPIPLDPTQTSGSGQTLCKINRSQKVYYPRGNGKSKQLNPVSGSAAMGPLNPSATSCGGSRGRCTRRENILLCYLRLFGEYQWNNMQNTR
ncbi:hypothetical protein O6P43_027019 [Quillaja saponaria]|uniref:Uncharacterized protein n=1 Tax=Quillaja saponaria TaxID=32244 RepID=A0AAD7L578_QUISA|nr:hypothetical protein O6P43_027019 [Quillaja saponaria]